MYKTIRLGNYVQVTDKKWRRIADFGIETGRPVILRAYRMVTDERIRAKAWEVIGR